MLEQLLKMAGQEITITSGSVILLLIWLFVAERKEKTAWIDKYHEKTKQCTDLEQVHAEQMYSVTRTLDKVLMSRGLIVSSEE